MAEEAADDDEIFELQEAPPAPPSPAIPTVVVLPPVEVDEEESESEAAKAKAAADRARHLATLSPVQRALLEREDDAKNSPFIEFWLPIILLVAGNLIAWIIWSQIFPTVSQGIMIAGILAAIQIVLFLPLGFGGTFLTAKWMDVDISNLMPTALKTAAIHLGPGAISDALLFCLFHFGEFEYTYVLVGFVIYMLPCAPPAAIMFRMGLNASIVMIATMVIPRFAALFLAALLYPKMFGVS